MAAHFFFDDFLPFFFAVFLDDFFAFVFFMAMVVRSPPLRTLTLGTTLKAAVLHRAREGKVVRASRGARQAERGWSEMTLVKRVDRAARASVARLRTCVPCRCRPGLFVPTPPHHPTNRRPWAPSAGLPLRVELPVMRGYHSLLLG